MSSRQQFVDFPEPEPVPVPVTGFPQVSAARRCHHHYDAKIMPTRFLICPRVVHQAGDHTSGATTEGSGSG